MKWKNVLCEGQNPKTTFDTETMTVFDTHSRPRPLTRLTPTPAPPPHFDFTGFF